MPGQVFFAYPTATLAPLYVKTICPICHVREGRRSRRRSLLDYLLGIGGVVPWRCEACEARFYARSFPLQNLRYAHCRQCGNLELQRISPEYVPGVFSIVGRTLHLPALRCEPCRHKFFSLRPVLKELKPPTATAGRAA